MLARAATKSCKFCGQEFVNNKILMRHIITSHESQQMDYLATSLHAQSEEKDSMDLDKIRPPENLSPPARKSTNAPKLLLPGFFHPTLKRGPIVEEAHERRAAVYKRKNGAIQNLGGVKEPAGYIVIDKSADGGNLVKIVTSVGTKHNSSNDGSQREKDDENRRRHLDITESLDRMLEEFEEEEREERKREESERSKDDRALEDMATSNDGEATSESGGTTHPVTLLGDKEKTCDTMEPGKERSPSEGEFLNISFHDEILTEEQGNSRKRRRLAIVRDSKVVGRLTTSSLFKPPQNSHPYANHVSQAASVSDQYDQFWTEIGLVPKIKQRTVDRKVAKGKSEQKKTHPTMINRIGPSAKTSPTKSICMKKFPSEGFSSPDTSNLPTQTKNNTSLNCDICSEVFTDNQILAQHVKEEHPLKNEESPRPPDTRKFKEGMWQVSNSLLRKKGLNKIKTEEEEVNSTKEGKTDNTLKDPMQPQKKVKEGLGNPGGKLKCNLCDFRTDFNWYLKKHTLSKHKEMNEYAFFCTKCPFKTNFKWNLKKHCNNKHSSCNSDTTTPKTDEDKTGKDLLNTNKRKGTDEAESSGTRSSQSKNGHSSPKINSLQKNGTHEKKLVSKKKKDVRRTKIKVSVGGFTDKKMSEVPELNPYSRQLSCSRKEGKVEEERDFEEERRRNLVESLTEPYCRLCQLLLEPELRFGLMAKGEGLLPKLPKSSVVWVPKRKEGTEEDTNIEEEEEEEEEASVISKLLVCSSCQLCVHRSCYLLPEEENKEGWTCQACNLPPASLCSLCQQPGGLLQRTDRGRLVHLDCALLLPETTITKEGRLSLTQVPDKRRCLECVICGGQESHPGVHCQVRTIEEPCTSPATKTGEQPVSGCLPPWLCASVQS